MSTHLDFLSESADQNINHSTTPTRALLHSKIYQSLTTPPTTHDNSTPLAERRKTQVSNYLVSQDFKTDFAIKLNHLRQREMNTNTTTHHNPSKHGHTHQEKTSITSNPQIDDVSIITSSSLQTGFPIPFSDSNSLKEEAETEDYSSASSIQKGILSCRSSVRVSEDPEEQNARYEVIRKLADQLAEQIEENDHLLYELGVVRSNNARLKSIDIDKEDELTCLNKRIRDLESAVAAKNNYNQPLDYSTPSKNSSNLPLDPTGNSLKNHSETEVQSLKSQLRTVKNSLCQIQLELNPSTHQSNHQFITNLSSCTNKLLMGFKTRQRGLGPVHSRRHSWSASYPQSVGTASSIDQLTEHNDHSHSFASSDCWFSSATGENNYEFFNKIHQLEVELFQCHEARITSGVKLQALIDSIDVDYHSSKTGKENKIETEDNAEMITNEKGMAKQAFDIDSSQTLIKDTVQLDSKLNNTDSMKGKSEAPSSTQEQSQQNVPISSHGSSSPLMGLASFGFSGWARKLSDTSPLSQEITSPKTSSSSNQMARIPSRTMSISYHQQDLNSTSLSPPTIEEPSGLIKCGFKSLFNYTSSTNANHNNSVTSDTMINHDQAASQLSSLVDPSSSTSLSSSNLPHDLTSSSSIVV